MKPLVIYHDSCTDGFAAAFAAWLKLGDKAEYLPMQYDDDLPFPWLGRDIYVLDFSFPREVMEALFEGANRVVWLDHHATSRPYAEEKCGGYIGSRTERHGKNYDIIHDNNKSGALLAWEYFYPGTEPPMLIRHIDDRDRWQFKLEGSKELHAAPNSRPFSFDAWKRIYFEPGYEQVALNHSYLEGVSILHAQDAIVKSLSKKAMSCSITFDKLEVEDSIEGHELEWNTGGYYELKGLAVNSPIHQSEIGHELANASGTFGLVWFLNKDQQVICSLRSNGDYDVSTIAKVFGGGGHKNAAGFKIDIITLMEWLR